MAGYGYSGREYDRYAAANADQSTIYKMKETYWTTKQAVMTKLGKKQDEHVVASDSELDAKLELFKAIQMSSVELLRVIERYQDRLCVLSREENAMGRLLKSQSGYDKTRAGKMMSAVGKAQCYSSQQMLGLRAPLVRLYQEVETFRYRAIADTLITVNRMEAARTEYRGALMWMKDASNELDPDTSKQLQKFRTIQNQVKKAKLKFDKLKLDTMQKIDLLAASRCNMFSHVLARYQTTLLQFWTKTSSRMSAVAHSFKGYQYFEFSMLKELGEPSKKLADETGATNDENLDIEDDDEFTDAKDAEAGKTNSDKAGLDRISGSSSDKSSKAVDGGKNGERTSKGSLNNLLDELDREFPSPAERNRPPGGAAGGSDSSNFQPFIDFGDDEEDVDLDEIKRKQDEEFDFTGMLKQSKAAAAASNVGKQSKSAGGGGENIDLLIDDLDLGGRDDLEKDDLTLLNEILNPAPGASGPNDFALEWTAVFGAGAQTTSPEHGPGGGAADFMPSCLLDMTAGGAQSGPAARDKPPGYFDAMQGLMNARGVGAGPHGGPVGGGVQPGGTSKDKQGATAGPKPKSKGQKQEMSAWFSLFAELDPLANPDAIGRNKDDLTDA